MRRLLRGNALRRFTAAAVGLFIVSAVAAPSASPARGDGATTIAVNAFQNEAGAPAQIAGDLSNAAYHAIATSARYLAKGGGPLTVDKGLTDDPFIQALQAAAKAGADELLLGSVIQASGGQVYYRLSLYRVAPVTFIRSQIFSQPYPAADAQALAAAIAGNLATLSAPRQALGTIYSTTDGVVADVGTEDGFMLGDRFSVRRNGERVADATITSIRDDDAVLTISSAAPGYKPMLGDELVGVRALAPVVPAPPNRSTFSPLGFFAAVGGVLLAIGHHGRPGVVGSSRGTPPPSSSPFSVQPQPIQVNLPQATFPFLFSNPLSATSITNIPAFISYVQVNTQLPGSQATSPPQTVVAFCNCQVQFQSTTGPLGNPETLMSVTATNLVAQEVVFFNFFPSITDQNGNTLAQPAFFQSQPLSIFRHPLSTPAAGSAGPAAPGPGAPGAKPGVGPKGPPPNPKPNPNDPHIPH